MIPILFDRYETDFTTNGIGRLSECSSCKATEERNGIYEVEFDYPITGKYYSNLIDPKGAIIGVIHDDKHDIQPFDIYSYTAPINGIVTFYAHHISYRLSRIIVKPFRASSPASVMSMMEINAANDNPFILWTDKAGGAEFTVDVPTDMRSLLYGSEGSILDIYGKGEYQFDNFFVKLYTNRGVKTDVTIRYGKNLVDIKKEYDDSDTFTAVAPYWKGSNGDEDEVVVYLPEIFIGFGGSPSRSGIWTLKNGDEMEDGSGNVIEFDYPVFSPYPLDLSSKFQEMPTTEELRQAALSYLVNNTPWIPHENITVDFVQLWQTEEYANVAALQRVSLCDTVSVYYPELGVIADDQKVVKVVYDVILERYSEMELGQTSKSFSENLSDDILSSINAEIDAIAGEMPKMSMIEQMIDHASDLITGGLGGYVVIKTNANDRPEEILIMDTPDVNTAVHVIRMNKNGIGFSNNGYNGPYRSAWTIDGVFNADFITAGTMLANRILGGTLTLGGVSNGNGVIHVLDASGNLVGTWDNTGLYLWSSSLYNKYGEYIYAGMSNQRRWPSYKRKALIDSGSFNVYTIQVKDASGNDISPVESLVGQFYGYASGVNIRSIKGIQFSTNNNNPTSIGYYTDGCVNIGNSIDPAVSRANNFEFIGDYFINLGNLGGTNHRSVLCWENRSGTTGGNWYIHTTGLYMCVNRPTDKPTGVDDLSTSLYREGGNAVAVLGPSELALNGAIRATDIYVSTYKSRTVKTDDYNNRLLYSYETPSPLFGDIGEGIISDDGCCYIWIDSIFKETIAENANYQVFLQKYGDGDCWVDARTPSYFIIKGTPNLTFGWELKAKQKGFEQRRLDIDAKDNILPTNSYGDAALEYLSELRNERGTL